MRPQEPTIRVRYIGRRDYWQDKTSLYGSGLDFEKCQVREVPAPLGKSFLRHHDLFERVTDDATLNDDTAEKLAEAKVEREEKDLELHEKMDLLAQIDQLDKAGLMQFAKVNYRQSLKQSDKLETMRDQVRELVERFGVA